MTRRPVMPNERTAPSTTPAPTASSIGTRLVLVTGASGYVGGRLVRALDKRGERVRCLARRPQDVAARVSPGIEVVGGDVLDAPSLERALESVDTAFYLVHGMGSRSDFRDQDRRGATNFALAARAAGVRRIVYLGGLGTATDLSPHLASRHEVGRILRDSGVPTIELRASIILGSGSLSFEMVRALVERLPVLVTPRWVRQLTQPIAIEDVIAYLVASSDAAVAGSEVVEIGGPDQVSYLDLIREHARQRGLKRLIIRVPVLTPWLSSLWLGLVTPVYARVGRKLIDSLRNETVVTSSRARELFPTIRPRGMREALERARANEDRELAETRWSDARSSLARRRRGAERIPDRGSSTRARYRSPRRRTRRSRRSRASGVTWAGTTRTGSGAFVARSTSSSAEQACGVPVATRPHCSPAIRSTSGAWKPSRATGSYGYVRR